ncbi:MAG: lipase maturation factor family protein, partial [Planctomycetota bacterium]
STPGRHPWLVHLVWKLLHNDPLALSLLANDPFPGAPPRFIRADLYRYRFTRPFHGGPCWERSRIGPWLPPMSRDDPRLLEFLGVRGLLEESHKGGSQAGAPRGPR